MRFVFFSAVILSALIAIYFLISGLYLYPLANVDGIYIWPKNYYDKLSGFEYYRNIAGETLNEKEVRRGILISLISEKIITRELVLRSPDLKEAETRVEEVLLKDGANIEKAARTLYGWDVGEFKKFSLLPQARQDILTEILQKEGIDFNEWLLAEFAKADVKIYFLPYKWEDGNLIDKPR